jgi:hypothetical protein
MDQRLESVETKLISILDTLDPVVPGGAEPIYVRLESVETKLISILDILEPVVPGAAGPISVLTMLSEINTKLDQIIEGYGEHMTSQALPPAPPAPPLSDSADSSADLPKKKGK